MQGHKNFQARLFYQLSLEQLVLADNYYRKIAFQLPLRFLYKATQRYYGNKGQESIVLIP